MNLKPKPGTLLDDTASGLSGMLKGIGQQIKNTPKDLAKAAARQVGVSEEIVTEDIPKNVEQPSQKAPDENTKAFIKSMYEGSEVNPKPDLKANADLSKTASSAKSSEEQQKIAALAQQLHAQEYYVPTFERKEEPEERPKEKVEREQQEEMIDLQEKQAKKPAPLAVTMERNKAEQFRGAAG